MTRISAQHSAKPSPLLLIDDDRSLASLVADYCSEDKYTVTSAETGEEGLVLARQQHFVLVILDVMLPGIDGFEVLKRLRRTLNTPVLMLTTRGAAMDRVQGLDGGADDYLAKPFQPEELVARIRSILRRVHPKETPSRYSVGDITVDETERSVTLSGQRLNLTSSEFRAAVTKAAFVDQQEALDLADVLDKCAWVILRLNKSELGENSETLAALILARFQNAVFVRKRRDVFTIYADEVQNLVGSGDTFEHLLSEARKFSVSVVTANQHLGQYSAQLRATLLSAGTTIFFRSSPEDSPFIARALDGGPALERRLKELPNRRFLIRSQGDHWSEVAASEIPRNTISTLGLVARSVARWARSRTAIEESIAARRGNAPRKDKLEEWQ